MRLTSPLTPESNKVLPQMHLGLFQPPQLFQSFLGRQGNVRRQGYEFNRGRGVHCAVGLGILYDGTLEARPAGIWVQLGADILVQENDQCEVAQSVF
ncbi:hypothetical protein M8J77_021166 [Diaphorina citri]|nr:hypothetical protein M8J77_021166 [Diaphorina citri]